jgi:predicted ATPase/DNA-binding NarL/FixJ family response regulator
MCPAAPRDSVSNLPAELTSFVGRRRELAEAKARLSTSRMLTLTGMGGVGKTRLARRLAAQVHRAFPDGVWQVEFADLHEPDLVVHTIAAALGLREHGGRSAITTLQDYLAGKHLLLLLDNCEHLIEACAVTADALLRTCPDLRILATSRERLAISGEQTYPVGPLPVPDMDELKQQNNLSGYESVTLFVDRADAVRSGFTVDASNRQAVARLCSRLDGVPLAIELAALRLEVLSPDQIVDRLEDRYRFLTRGSRSSPQRQQTLRALVDWSYQLCSEQERLLWCYGSVFSGGFELDAAEAIHEGTPIARQDVLDLVVGLVDKSILVCEERAGVVRYRLLEMIREYGLEHLRSSGEETTVRRRHRDWYVALAVRAYAEYLGSSQLGWYTRLRLEHANLRAALEFSLSEPGGAVHVVDIVAALIHYWTAFAMLSEGRHWLDRALRQRPEPDGLTRARALRTMTMLALLQGDQSSATEMLDESRALAERAGSHAELAWVTHAGARIPMVRGDLDAATQMYEEAVRGFQASGDNHGLVHALGGLVFTAALSGDPDGTARRADDLLALVPPGEPWARAYVTWSLGIAHWRKGDDQKALELEVESMTLRRPFDDKLGDGMCIEVLAWVAATQNRSTQAAELLGASQYSLSAIGTSVAIFQYMLTDHRRCEADLRNKLGDANFEASIERGSDLSFDEIIARATGAETAGPKASQAGAEVAPSPLTRREGEIANLIAQGMSNKEIAANLVIAQRTAEGHVEKILLKLGFNSRAQVARWVAERRAAGDET